MTFLAVDDAMLPAEGEPTLVMVERDGFPGRFAMAVFALIPLLSIMFVVFFVAGMTVARCFLFVEMALVADFAGKPNVFPSQGVFGVPVMIEQQLFPILFDMAIPTIITVCVFMFVVFFVAGITVGRRFLFVEVPLMAGFAFCGLVLPFQ